MDVRRLRGGELLAGGAAIGLLAVMFLEWFGGQTAWQTLTIGRIVLVVTALCALTLFVLTLMSRPVSLTCSAAVITVVVAAVAALYLVYRVGINEPGPNGAVDVGLGAYLGLALVLACSAGAWRTLADERTQAASSLRQTERVLAVRGASRPAPPAHDPGHGAQQS